MSGATPMPREAVRKMLERVARELGEVIESCLPSGKVGFALSLFTFSEPRYLAWISNADRADMIRALREQADRLEHGMGRTAGEA